jgi:hypothetical protein
VHQSAWRFREKDAPMTQLTDQSPVQSSRDTDLGAAVQRVLAASPEPLTLSKIRAQLPAPFRSASLEELGDYLHRQVAANVLYQFPKYRSQQDRFWDRPMEVHIATLLQDTLQERPLALSELRRKLPSYAVERAEVIVIEQVAQGKLHRHPRSGKRGGDRFGVMPADPKDYLRSELAGVFQRMQEQGFAEDQVRAAALELLHDEEWSPAAEAQMQEASERQEREAPQASGAVSTQTPAHAQASEAGQRSETHPNAPDAGASS